MSGRIEEAYAAFLAAPAPLSLGDRERRTAGALHGLVGYLRALERRGAVTAEAVADAVEYTLRVSPGSEPRPPQSVDLRALGSCREGRRAVGAR